jgi:peptidoglycan/xylan/chitin deacetylase (PgdA/CDA1 family)
VTRGARSPAARARRPLAAALLALCWASRAGLAAERIEVVVTVDDLPTHGPLTGTLTRPEISDRLIAALRRHRVPGVYGFANARQLEDAPEHDAILRAWARAGFWVGNHTYSHLDARRVPPSAYVADIDRNDEALARLLGPAYRRVFRYAHLAEGDSAAARRSIRRHLAQQGYRIAPVTIDFADWAWTNAYARCAARGDAGACRRLRRSFLEEGVASLRRSDRAAREILGRPIPHVLLLHVGELTAVTLDELLVRYREAGVDFVGLDVALEDPSLRIPADPDARGPLEELRLASRDDEEQARLIRRLEALCP